MAIAAGAVGYLRANANADGDVVQVERTEVQHQSAFALFQTVLTGLQEGKSLHIAEGLSAREFVVEVYDNRYLAKLGCFWDLLETILNIFLRCLTCLGCEETEAGQVATLAGAIRDFPLVAGNYSLISMRNKMAALANNLLNIPVERRDAIFQSIKQNPQEYPFWGIETSAAAIGQMSLQQLWAYFDGLQPYLDKLDKARGDWNQTIADARSGGLELSMIRALEQARGGDLAAAVANIPNPDNYVVLYPTDPGAEAVHALICLCWEAGDGKSLGTLFGLGCIQHGWMEDRKKFAERILEFAEISDDLFTALISIIRPLKGEQGQADFLVPIFKRFLDGNQLTRAFEAAKVVGVIGEVGKNHGIKCYHDLITKYLEAKDFRTAIDVTMPMFEHRYPELERIIEVCLKSGRDEYALQALDWHYGEGKNRLVQEMVERFLKDVKLEFAARAVLMPPSISGSLPDSRKEIVGQICDALIKANKWTEATSLIRKEWNADQEFIARAKQVYEGALADKEFMSAKRALQCLPMQIQREHLALFEQLAKACRDETDFRTLSWLEYDIDRLRKQQPENKSENKERT